MARARAVAFCLFRNTKASRVHAGMKPPLQSVSRAVIAFGSSRVTPSPWASAQAPLHASVLVARVAGALNETCRRRRVLGHAGPLRVQVAEVATRLGVLAGAGLLELGQDSGAGRRFAALTGGRIRLLRPRLRVTGALLEIEHEALDVRPVGVVVRELQSLLGRRAGLVVAAELEQHSGQSDAVIALSRLDGHGTLRGREAGLRVLAFRQHLGQIGVGVREAREELDRALEPLLDRQQPGRLELRLPRELRRTVVAVGVRRPELDGSRIGFLRPGLVAVAVREQPFRVVARRRARVGRTRLADRRLRLDRAVHRHLQAAAQRGDLGRRHDPQRLSGFDLRLRLEAPVREEPAPGVGRQGPLECRQVPERLGERLVVRAARLPEPLELVQLGGVDPALGEHQVVHEHGTLGVELPAVVLLLGQGRVSPGVEDRLQRQSGALTEVAEQPRHGPAEPDLVLADRGVPEHRRQTVREPERQAALEAAREERLQVGSIRVVRRSHLGLARPRVRAQQEEEPVGTVGRARDDVDPSLHLEVAGSPAPERPLVLQGEDDRRPSGLESRPGPDLLVGRPHLLELAGGPSCGALAGVRHDREARRLDLDPGLGGGCVSRHRAPRQDDRCEPSHIPPLETPRV